MQKNTTPKREALSQFVDLFRHDLDFRALAESDAHAALRHIGIQVPQGLHIRFAASAASAIGMVLDGPNDIQYAPTSTPVALDDEMLMQVNGGTTAATDIRDEFQQFFDSLWRSITQHVRE